MTTTISIIDVTLCIARALEKTGMNVPRADETITCDTLQDFALVTAIEDELAAIGIEVDLNNTFDHRIQKTLKEVIETVLTKLEEAPT